MSRRIPLRRLRQRIFFGCEGESEYSYGGLLQRLLDEQRRAIHLERVNLGGGDPLAMIEKARRAIKTNLADVQNSADKFGLRLILQHPCHEAFLLRHFDGCATLRPPTSDQSERELKRRWPEYRKGMPAMRLAERIDFAALQRARTAEALLDVFPGMVGL